MYIDMDAVWGTLIALFLFAVAYAFVVLVFVVLPSYKRIKHRRKEVEKEAKRIKRRISTGAQVRKRHSNRHYLHGVMVVKPDKD